MSANHLDVVQRLHDEHPPAKTLEGALGFLLRLLAALPAHEKAGLLSKPGGENIIDYKGQMVSAGRICYPDGQLYKVLTDIPTTNGPGWQDDGTVDPNRYIKVEGGVEEPADDDPPPHDDGPILARLDAFEARLQFIADEMRAFADHTEAVVATEVRFWREKADAQDEVIAGLRIRLVAVEAKKVPSGVSARVNLGFGRSIPIHAELTY